MTKKKNIQTSSEPIKRQTEVYITPFYYSAGYKSLFIGPILFAQFIR